MEKKNDALSEKHMNKQDIKTKEYQNDRLHREQNRTISGVTVVANDGSALRSTNYISSNVSHQYNLHMNELNLCWTFLPSI